MSISFLNVEKSKLTSRFFDNIKDIKYKNHGGCLFFCYLFFLFLKKENANVSSFSINQLGYPHQLERNKEYFDGLHDYAESSCHFTWVYDGIEYDSEGELGDRYSNYERMPLKDYLFDEDDIHEFCISALKYGGWNDTFDREFAKVRVQQSLGLKVDV